MLTYTDLLLLLRTLLLLLLLRMRGCMKPIN
jgi:hypothetical protein